MIIWWLLIIGLFSFNSKYIIHINNNKISSLFISTWKTTTNIATPINSTTQDSIHLIWNPTPSPTTNLNSAATPNYSPSPKLKTIISPQTTNPPPSTHTSTTRNKLTTPKPSPPKRQIPWTSITTKFKAKAKASVNWPRTSRQFQELNLWTIFICTKKKKII